MSDMGNKTDVLTPNDLDKIAEKEKVERLEQWAKKVGEKVGVRLEI